MRDRTRHVGPLALFAALTVGWTWPLVLHLHDAIPGDPGDNYSFLWYLWWMRHVLATPGLAFFHTTFLFYPFGASIANNPHTALPALIGATLLGRASVVTAQNTLLVAYVFANMVVMYALAWDVTKHIAASVLAAVVFGLSPYVAAHFPGHFELMAVWTLPAFAIFFRRACRSGSPRTAIAAGLVAAATAYTSYYYFVYQALFALVFLAAWTGAVAFSTSRRVGSAASRAQTTLLVLVAIAVSVAGWVALTGGGRVTLGGASLSATTPQGALTVAWALALAWALCRWDLRVLTSVPGLWKVQELPPGTEVERSGTEVMAAAAIVAATAIAGTAPLLYQGIRLVTSGAYVTPVYFWRSAPRGVDLLAPLLGHPAHPLFRAISARAYAALHLDPIEAIGWFGVVPALILLTARTAGGSRERRAWRAVAIAFAIWAAGPFLTIGGFDTGLKLPEILVRWIPFVANARMPGRAVVGVFLAIAILAAMTLRAAEGPLARGAAAWVAIALVIAEFWDAPIRLTYLDAPPVYQTLAAAPPGAVCEVPFGIGDGLSGGRGSKDRRALYYATLHEHPLVGGYLGRMPADADARYDRMPVVGTLLRLSDPAAAPTTADQPAGNSPCGYLVVNRAASSRELLAYVTGLPADLLASDEHRDLYRLR